MSISDGIPLLATPSAASVLETCMAAVEEGAVERADLQECHGTASNVLELLGGEDEGYRNGWSAFKARHQSDSAGVYRVDLRIPATDVHARWDHSFAVLKVGSDTVIYQAFQRSYSLASFLNGSAGAHARKYAAVKGVPLDPTLVREFFLGMERMLQCFVDGKKPTGLFSCFYSTPDYEAVTGRFFADATRLFGAPVPSPFESLVVQNAVMAGSVQLRWKRAPLK